MACKFSFVAKVCEGMQKVVFPSDTGEEYYVNFEVDSFGRMLLSIEWTVPKHVLIVAELRTEYFKLLSSKHTILKGIKTQLGFGDQCQLNNIIVIISVIPCVDLWNFRFTAGKETSLKNSNKAANSGIADEEMADVSNMNTTVHDIPSEKKGTSFMKSAETQKHRHAEETEVSGKKCFEFNELSLVMQNMLIGLAIDMKDLLENDATKDAVLTNGDIDLNVHSAIVSVRSPVFKELLQSSLPEKKISVESASNDALNDMVQFIYTGLIKIKDKMRAEELSLLANRYEMEDLFELCSDYLSNLTADDPLSNKLALTEKYKTNSVKTSSSKFLVERFNRLKTDKKWMSFAEENPNLVAEVSSIINDSMEKNIMCEFMLRLSLKH